MIYKIIFAFLVALPSSHAQGFWNYLWQDRLQPTFARTTDRSSFIILSVGLTATIIATGFDNDIQREWGDNKKLSRSVTQYGDLLGTGIPGGLTALGQYYWDRPNGKNHIEALLVTAVTTFALKHTIQRPRPAAKGRDSMPSGHTSTTFATATSLTNAYGWGVGVPAYLLATFTAMTRWSDNAHYLSDTVAGATLGILFGRATFHEDATGADVSWVPWLDHHSAGIQLQAAF